MIEENSNRQLRKRLGILKLVADSPTELCPCDVDRVMSVADGFNILSNFRIWLCKEIGIDHPAFKNVWMWEA